MKPYRVAPSSAASADEPSSPDYGHFEQLAIYLFIAIAVIALALNEIKIP